MPQVRFFRRISLIPGWLYLNLSKSGLSISVGPRGWTITFGKRGIRFSVGLPGSGLSVSEDLRYDQLASKVGKKSKKAVAPEASAVRSKP